MVNTAHDMHPPPVCHGGLRARGGQYMLQKLTMLFSAAGLVMTVACSQTDPGITTAVKTKLAADDTVKAYQIDVDTSKGVVTLTGIVEVPAAKEQAVLIARRTDGVKDVVDRITVNQAA